MNEIFRVIVEKYEFIKLAEKRMVIPFIKGDGKYFPKKYQDEKIYKWNKDNKLVFIDTGEIVPRNPKVAGKPRFWRINGQDVYNQKVKHSARAAIMKKLHALFEYKLKRLDPIKNYPIGLRLNFYTLDFNKEAGRDKNIDNDNRWIYDKVIMDCLRDLKIIPDDNPYYVNENIKKTIFVDDIEQVRLEIIGYVE